MSGTGLLSPSRTFFIFCLICLLSGHNINRHVENLRNLQNGIDMFARCRREMMGGTAFAPAGHELPRSAGKRVLMFVSPKERMLPSSFTSSATTNLNFLSTDITDFYLIPILITNMPLSQNYS